MYLTFYNGIAKSHRFYIQKAFKVIQSPNMSIFFIFDNHNFEIKQLDKFY